MTEPFESGKAICLLDPNAHCNPIWVSEPEGLHFAHFQTFAHELPKQGEDPAAYENCARHCLAKGGRSGGNVP